MDNLTSQELDGFLKQFLLNLFLPVLVNVIVQFVEYGCKFFLKLTPGQTESQVVKNWKRATNN